MRAARLVQGLLLTFITVVIAPLLCTVVMPERRHWSIIHRRKPDYPFGVNDVREYRLHCSDGRRVLAKAERQACTHTRRTDMSMVYVL